MKPRSLNLLLQPLAARQDLVLVGLLVLTIVMMILPMPTVFADILIATNIAISTLLMMVAIYIRGPVEFSTLPTVILITTAFRLSLSITTSRMVLVQGDAGQIIRTFGDFIVAGNVVVGLVIYLIISIVQFVVITKGSERVAEVAARFTLDALPGKQISIDTDLKNGDIDQKEARRRRQTLEKESQLYGAMDGAMKFVKGDAIASLVIIVVNLIGGMAIGCAQRGLSFSDAVHTYSLLAIGDGLIAQIPALLISLTAGVIVTRVTSEAGRNLGQDVLGQITAEPRTLQIAALVLGGLAFVPGFPKPVFLTLAIVIGASGLALARRHRADAARAFAEAEAVGRTATEPATLVFFAGSDLAARREPLQAALEQAREQVAHRLGIQVPAVRLALAEGARMDQAPDAWRLEMDAMPIAAGRAVADRSGPDRVEAVAETVRTLLLRSAAQFVGIQETQAMLTRMESGFADLVREATKGAALPRMADVLRRLVDEGVPLTALRTVLEAIAEWGPREQNPAMLAEHVRAALRRHICHDLADAQPTLSVVLVEGSLDEALRGAVHATPSGTHLMLDPAALDRLVGAVRGHLDALYGRGLRPALLASVEVRRHLRAVLARRGLFVAVLSHAELTPEIGVQVAATLRHSQVAPAPPPRPREDTPRLAAIDTAA